MRAFTWSYRTHIKETVSGVTRGISYTYDWLYRLTAADYSTGEAYAYQYDPVGNRTAMTDTAVHTYAYDAANRLTNADGVVHTWDNRGNLLADGTFTYTYSAAGRMVQAQNLTATLVYTYNADGLRVARSQSVASVQSVDTFAWDWATGVPELLSDGESLYLIGYDTLGWQNGEVWTFVLPDALGSVRQELVLSEAEGTDAAGTVIATREWSPYGEELGGVQTGLGFTGEWFDSYIGLTYLRARWYAEKNGSFISPDFITPNFYTPQSINVYVYVVGNPIRFTDPSGNVPYNRDAAVGYAMERWDKINSIYGGFGEKDCTNFVSQALLAGDFPPDETWFFETTSESGTPSRCNRRCCTNDFCKFFRRDDTATCGNAWTLTDKLYEYLTQEKGFDWTPLEGTQEPTGLDAYGKKLRVEFPVLPWASDLDERGFWRTETLGSISEKVKEGDVVFYLQEHASDVRSGKSKFNHAAFVVGFGMQTRRGAVEYAPPYPPPTPYIVDHSSTFSRLGRRAITDRDKIV